MSKVSIVVCWRHGTEDMITACLKSIGKHTKDVDYDVMLVSLLPCESNLNPMPILKDIVSVKALKVIGLPMGVEEATSKTHGKMLDAIIPNRIDSEYFLTLDSDCFPVADGWLSDLIKMLENGAKVAGILHPWAPPVGVATNKIEYRVRSQHCWERTHVACQLMRTKDYLELHANGCRFNGGDDTGLLIPKMVKEMGGIIDGFKVTRCPKVWEGDLDPEFNRYVCLVFGDKVYHHGGFSRVRTTDDERVFGKSFTWCEDLVLWGRGAEFLLNDRFCYKFKLDREEDVAKEKMERLFGLSSKRLAG
jgi:hypothetical protein